jgi:hypothetical protein
MTLDQAQKLVADLGTQLGGNSSTFSMSEQGDANFLFEGKIPLQIRHFENTLIIAASVATDIPEQEEAALLPTLMAYQFMGLRTHGHVLSWNPDAGTLLLSRHMQAEGEAISLMREVEILLRSANRVQADLARMLEGSFPDLVESKEAGGVADLIHSRA